MPAEWVSIWVAIRTYRYRDGNGQWRLTYKLHLSPTLRNSRWGPFLDMWRELLQADPTIPELIEANGCHIRFEMYGARNAHLVLYERDLAVAALFGVAPDASVIPLHKLKMLDVPGASFFIRRDRCR